MSKPDWKDAPEWANYLAMDGGGDWRWFELKPCPLFLYRDWCESVGKTELAAKSNPAWVDSLEPRPE